MNCEGCGTAIPPNSPICPVCFRDAAAESPDSLLRRPPGITALAIFNLSSWVASIFFVLAFIPALARTPDREPYCSAMVWILVSSTVHLFASIGLWRLRPYGKRLEKLLALGWIFGFPVGTLLAILTWIYFARPAIKALFSQSPVDEWTDRQVEDLKKLQLKSSRWPICLAAGFGAVGIALSVLLLLMTTRVLWPRSDPMLQKARQLRSRQRAESTQGFTELLHLSLDDPSEIPQPPKYYQIDIDIDPANSTDGRGSVQASSKSEDWAVRIATLPLSKLPRRESTLLFEAMILEEGLEGRSKLSIRLQPFNRLGDELDQPRYKRTDWVRRQAVYFLDEGETPEGAEFYLRIRGKGTVQIDQVRVLHGPAWKGFDQWMGANRARHGAQVAPPPEEVRAVLTGDDFDGQVKLLNRLGSLPSLPDEVQKALIEAYIEKHREACEQIPPQVTPLRRWVTSIFGPRGDPPLKYQLVLQPWNVHAYYQPDTLEALFVEDPQPRLVDTYGEGMVPLLMSHPQALDDPERRRGYLRTILRFHDHERDGKTLVDNEAKDHLSELLESEWKRISHEDKMDTTAPSPMRVPYPIHELMSSLAWVSTEEQRSELMSISAQRLLSRRRKGNQVEELEHMVSMKLTHADEILQVVLEAESHPLVEEHLKKLLDAWEEAPLGIRVRRPDELWAILRESEPWEISMPDPEKPWLLEISGTTHPSKQDGPQPLPTRPAEPA